MLTVIAIVAGVLAASLCLRTIQEKLDLKSKYQTALGAVDVAAGLCATTILENETNIKWLYAMRAAFIIDQADAQQQLALARTEYEKGNYSKALLHLQKASNWYDAYNARLKRIYGLEAGTVPPIPIIQN